MFKTKNFEKRQTFQWKNFLTYFSQSIECDRPQGTIYESPQGILTITVEVTGLIL